MKLEEDRTAHLPTVWEVAKAFGLMALVGVAMVLVGGLISLCISVSSHADGVVATAPAAVSNSVGNYVVNPAQIISVYDGDTFYIKVPECAELVPSLCARLGVRVNGIDTPEMQGKCQWERDHAARAKALTIGMLQQAKSVVLHHVEREKYGRLLASVEIDGVDLGATLISGGYARAYHGEARTGWCNEPQQKEFL